MHGIQQQEINYGAIWTFQYNLNNNSDDSISKTLVKGLDLTTTGSMSIETTTDQIIIAGTNINETINITSATEQAGYGFGFFSSHYSHNCTSIGSFSLENCVYVEVKLIPHNVYVDPNGGTWRNSSNVTALEGVRGDSYSIGIPVRNGYTFAGWEKIGNSGTMSSLTGDATYTFGEDEEVDDRLVAQWIKIDATKQSDITTGKVVQDQEITYTITATNRGTVDGTAIIKDAPPEGTTFVPNSIMINGVKSSYTQANLASGINVAIQKPSTGQTSRSSTLSFKVKVNKLINNTLIKNSAQYKDITISTNSEEKTTNEVVLKYVEPIISQSKAQLTQNKESYVVNGEKVTYTINISNDGGLEKEVVVRDNIPEGTTFVERSVKINGVNRPSIGESELSEGVKITIPEETRNQTLSFEVIVNDINDEDIIKNVATVDGEETNEVILRYVEPIISIEKSVNTQYNEEYVISGETVRYNIIVKNEGSLEKKVIIKDKIPEGVKFVKNSIKVNEELYKNKANKAYDETDLEKGIEVLVPQKTPNKNKENTESKTNGENENTEEEAEKKEYNPGETILSFEVKVKDINDEDIIKNVAMVDGEETNEVSLRYVEPIISIEKSANTQYNKEYVTSGETIRYNIIVRNEGGLEKKVIIKDKIPEGAKFVKNSIKLNEELYKNKANKVYNEIDLEKGIEVLVPEKTPKENKEETEGSKLNDNKEDTEESKLNDNKEETEESKTNENKEDTKESKTNENKEDTKESKTNENKEDTKESKTNENKEDTKESKTNENKEETEESKLNGNKEETEEDKPNGEDENTEEETEKKEYKPSETILSFEVIVNKLEKDTDTAKITNIATVDGEKTNEVTHQVNPFNMKIEEKIEELYIDDTSKNVGDGKMLKAEVHTKKVNTTSVIAKYKIIVTNTGKVEGTATIQDSIPQGYEIASTNPTYWQSTKDRKIQATTEVIKPGESKTLEVVLVWQNGQSNFGEKINKAEIIETNNESNAPETTLEDNTSEATIIMSIMTGKINDSQILIGASIISSIILVIGIIVIKKTVLG